MPSKRIHVPSLEGGMDTQVSPILLKLNQQRLLENLHWQQATGWSTLDIGYEAKNSSPLNNGSVIHGLYTFQDVSGLDQTLVQAGDTLFHVNPLIGTVIKSIGTTYDSPNQYVTFLGWCFILNSSCPPKRWNGTNESFENMVGWPYTAEGEIVGNPSLGCVYANRLVLAGDATRPNTIYLSALEDPEDFTPTNLEDSAGAIQISPGDGQRITGLIPLYVPYSNEHVLLVFKTKSIYALRGADASSFRIELVSNTLGTQSPQSFMAVGQDVWFLSSSGINALGPNTQLGILAVGSLSSEMQGRLPSLNQAQLHKAFALHDPIQKELWWCVPTESSTVCNEVWVQNYSQSPHKWSLRKGLNMTCGHTLPLGQLLSGDASGRWHQQRKGHTYNGTNIPWRLISSTYSLGDFNTQSRLTTIDVYLSRVGAENFDAYGSWEMGYDGGDSLTPSVTVSAGGLDMYGLGFFNTARFGSHAKGIARLYPEGSGRLFELTLSGVIPSQPIAITGYSLTYIEGGDNNL
jgi:hypothetical protein